jgi:hypothetical protein
MYSISTASSSKERTQIPWPTGTRIQCLWRDKPVSDALTPSQQTAASLYATQRKPAARKKKPEVFVHRITFCVDSSELECLKQAKLAFRSTESFLVRMALDTFLKSQGLMSPTGFPINGGNGHGR